MTQEAEREKRAVTSDSGAYKWTFYGILNAQGDFWTPIAFETADKARQHIINFWRKDHDSRDKCLRTHKIVPVRVQLTALDQDDPD